MDEQSILHRVADLFKGLRMNKVVSRSFSILILLENTLFAQLTDM